MMPTGAERPLRICFPFIGNNVGGSHISTLLLVKNLDPEEVEPIIVLHEEGQLSSYLRQQNLDYCPLHIRDYFVPPYRSARNILKLIRHTLRIASFLRHSKIDIVHANDARIHFGWTLATKLARAKLIWHQRTATFGRSRVKLWCALQADKVICISRFTASTLPDRLLPLADIVADPFEVCESTTSREQCRSILVNELGIAADTQIVGFFGNLVEQKRPQVFLRAAAGIATHHDGQVAFVLFGAERSGSSLTLNNLAKELGIGEQVHFMGFRTPVEPWIAGCDVLVAPAVREGLGRSVIEAMLLGTPVVAADNGGHKEIVTNGETGYLVETDNADAFAAAVCRLLQDPALAANIAARAKSKALCDYSVEHHVSEMMNVFRESLGKSNPAPSPAGPDGSISVGSR